MAKNILQLNYDELSTIAKKFKDEGEDAFKLHSATRQRVRDLHKEWIGDAAENFFDEMENELLPALQRSKALHFSQDVVSDIMKMYSR
jgi:WXG100 family type VII secretion target